MGFKIPNFYTQNNSPLKNSDLIPTKGFSRQFKPMTGVQPVTTLEEAQAQAAAEGKELSDIEKLLYDTSVNTEGFNFDKSTNPNFKPFDPRTLENDSTDFDSVPAWKQNIMNQTVKVGDTTNPQNFGLPGQNIPDKIDDPAVDEFRENLITKQPKDPSKVKWSEAPPLGTQERTQWYIDNDLKLDKTTPPLAGADPEPIEEVITSSAPRARNNRRTRRAERIRERNEKAELRSKGIKGDIKEGIIDGSFAFDDDEFQDSTVA